MVWIKFISILSKVSLALYIMRFEELNSRRPNNLLYTFFDVKRMRS
jgi:hypothetical protein